MEDAERSARLDRAGHAVHVIGTERLLEGLPAAEPLPGDAPPHVRNPIGELNEREVAARRTRSGAEVLAEWDELRARRQPHARRG